MSEQENVNAEHAAKFLPVAERIVKFCNDRQVPTSMRKDTMELRRWRELYGKNRWSETTSVQVVAEILAETFPLPCPDPSGHTITLDDYEVANLQSALISIGLRGASVERSPLYVLNTGDWAGHILWKLPLVAHEPNWTPEQLAREANRFDRPPSPDPAAVAVLRELVDLKDNRPTDYEERKPRAWEAARAVLRGEPMAMQDPAVVALVRQGVSLAMDGREEATLREADRARATEESITEVARPFEEWIEAAEAWLAGKGEQS